MANVARSRSMRGRNPQAIPLIVIIYVFVMSGVAFETFRVWFYMGAPLIDSRRNSQFSEQKEHRLIVFS
jgi:hypothetical protein